VTQPDAKQRVINKKNQKQSQMSDYKLNKKAFNKLIQINIQKGLLENKIR
jgi:hypothetical protein